MLRSILPSHQFVGQVEIVNTIDQLQARLKQPITKIGTVALIVSDDKELEAMLKLKHLFRELKIIIVLPQNVGESNSQVFQLFPRFVFNCDVSMWDFVAIIHNLNRRKEPFYQNHKRMKHQGLIHESSNSTES